ncbi:MAG: ribonuclease D [Pseudomonadota bacterium]
MAEITVHKGDLASLDKYTGDVAIDTEAMGLLPQRDRLCVVQLSCGDGTADVVQIARGQTSAPNLEKLLGDPARTKIFHYARFDVALLFHSLNVMTAPIFCTKIASRLTRTYTDQHGLKALTKELLGLDMSKQQQSSDWGADTLSDAQLAYAASDVLHLHALKAELDKRLDRDGRRAVADACFTFLPVRATLDLMGWHDSDIFAHS